MWDFPFQCPHLPWESLNCFKKRSFRVECCLAAAAKRLFWWEWAVVPPIYEELWTWSPYEKTNFHFLRFLCCPSEVLLWLLTFSPAERGLITIKRKCGFSPLHCSWNRESQEYPEIHSRNSPLFQLSPQSTRMNFIKLPFFVVRFQWKVAGNKFQFLFPLCVFMVCRLRMSVRVEGCVSCIVK